ncbi:MAG: translation elongation factor Ts [Deltaproteobacteria bacterium]|nr:translation elongation factor Ts [Deltaproteobacteria bacterium]
MANVTAAMVKELRERTQAGMMDCKNALEESGGNMDGAAEILMKKGQARVAKAAGKIAADGLVHAYIHQGGRLGVLVEVNSQTDFVARSEEFKTFVDDVALQIASMAPQYVRREEIAETTLAKQREIFVAQLAEEEAQTGKSRPEAARAKIIDGKLAKWVSEVCLVEQTSVRITDKTIQQLSDELTARTGEKIAVRRFVRYELGEGIKTQQADFASEVAAMKS